MNDHDGARMNRIREGSRLRQPGLRPAEFRGSGVLPLRAGEAILSSGRVEPNQSAKYDEAENDMANIHRSTRGGAELTKDWVRKFSRRGRSALRVQPPAS